MSEREVRRRPIGAEQSSVGPKDSLALAASSSAYSAKRRPEASQQQAACGPRAGHKTGYFRESLGEVKGGGKVRVSVRVAFYLVFRDWLEVEREPSKQLSFRRTVSRPTVLSHCAV